MENPLTLFTECPVVKVFWFAVKQYLDHLDHDLPTGRLQILFGIHTETFDSVKNIAILIGKRTIWISKFKKNPPCIEHFKNNLKDYLIILRFSHCLNNTSSTVFNDQWGRFFWLLQGYHGPQLPAGDEQADG